MLSKPKVEIVGTPDLPEALRKMYEGSGLPLLHAHERVMGPLVDGGHTLIGYRVQIMRIGLPHIATCLVGDDGVTFFEDGLEVLNRDPSTFVPCRTDYHVCPDCLRELRAHAHVIEGESLEDRPMPSVNDAWDQVEGCAGLCGGDHCEDPPERVVWTKADGSVSVRDFESTMDASMTISGVVQWDPGLSERGTQEVLTPDEIIEAYEALEVHSSGDFLRLGLDPDTGEPVMPEAPTILHEGMILNADAHIARLRWHGVVFRITMDGNGGWIVETETHLPEPSPTWG